MKKAIFFLGFIASIFTVNGQEIRGFVFSTSDKSPVEFASVVLTHLPDSAFVTGIITYSEGGYSFSGVKPGKYLVKSTFMGYNDGFAEVDVNENQKVCLADTIFLAEKTNAIGEVVVKGDLVRGEELVDRTVYSIPPEIAKTSVNGYEILRKVPSVQVDFNNNITLNGSSNFIITVDGKQRDKEFLARLVPEDIKTIEIIHNPSGKYDGSIDGVINVKLNNAARVGLGGNYVIAGKPGKTNMIFGNAGLDYGREHVTFYISGYGFVQNLQNYVTNYYKFQHPSMTDSIVDVDGSGDFSIAAGSINAGFDYYIDDKNTLSLNYSYKPNLLSTELNNRGLIYLGTDNDYNQISETSTGTNSQESNISAFYRKEFKKPIQELTVESTIYTFNSDDENNYNSQISTSGNLSERVPVIRDELINNDRNYLSTKVDYVHPIGINTRLETGYQFYYQTMMYDFRSNEAASNNIFNYDEIRNAAYAGWTFNYKDFGFQTTHRVEYSNILINDDNTNDYFVYLPSVNVQYKISGAQNLKFTFNSRINRPGIYNLNPYQRLDNDFNISSGNPDLEPERFKKLELKYTLNFKKNFISPYIYYQMISNKISTINEVFESPLVNNSVNSSHPENILTGYEKGFGINAMLWQFNIDGSIFQGKFNENSKFNIPSKDYFSYNVRSYAFAPLLKEKLNAFVFVGYQGVRVEAQSKTYSTPFYGIGGQYNYKDHSFGAFYLLPFAKELEMSRTITETDYMYSEAISSFDVRYFVQLQYAYKFNKGRSVKKISHESEVESDTKGGGINR
ncbi:MAG: TonB-dependent receptor [Bacteroidales bacterium]|nr:TonB-dependent receptor [Bacteroidales bacterium]MBN2818039.1 TonB-dependent receptor [Bacteroidales bacterium]